MRTLNRANVFWFVVVMVMLVLFLFQAQSDRTGETISYSDFTRLVEQHNATDVVIKGQGIRGKFRDNGVRFQTTGPIDSAMVEDLLTAGKIEHSYQKVESDNLWVTGAMMVIPLLVVVFLFAWFMRNVQGSNSRAFSFGRARPRLYEDGDVPITFDDVAGIDECKEELQEIVEFLKNPGKFTRLGGRIPKGVLLMGAPGTGKTLLAKAVAGEADVPFFSISGSDFVEMFVGVGASRVRDLFEQGKKNQPCIIFIDEIDAVGRHRGAGLGGGHDEREQTLNALLVEMDGFDESEEVILMAATNRPDVLDPALLRPGRFDRRVMVPAPDVKGRELILKVHTRRLPLGESVDLQVLAQGTPGFSGADLENLCNEAALLAARHDQDSVEQNNFMEAREKSVMGPERRSLVTPEKERKSTAFHEAGHALVAHILPSHDPVQKVTIVPRGRSLGSTWTLPVEERLSWTRGALMERITMMMGGRAGEKVALNVITNGAKQDLEQATQLARQMVCDFGMSEELGPIALGDQGDEVFLGRQMGSRTKAYSEETAQRIDREIQGILTGAYSLAVRILTDNVHILNRITEALLEHETLDNHAFAKLVDSSDPVIPGDIAWMGS
jgi:cell division protease FtsH